MTNISYNFNAKSTIAQITSLINQQSVNTKQINIKYVLLLQDIKLLLGLLYKKLAYTRNIIQKSTIYPNVN